MLGWERALAFLALALLAELAGTVGGFGSSTFFVPIANFFFDFESVLGITAVFHLLSNLSKLGLFRAGFDRNLLIWLGVPSVVGSLLGAAATAYVPTQLLKIALGGFLIAVSSVLLLKPHLSLKPTQRIALLGGGLSGLMAGMIGTGGAIRGLTLAAFALPKEIFVATSAAIDMGIDLARAAVYWQQGFVHAHDAIWLPLLGIAAFIGTYLGRAVLQRIPQERFRTITLSLILAIGCLTLYETFRTVT